MTAFLPMQEWMAEADAAIRSVGPAAAFVETVMKL